MTSSRYLLLAVALAGAGGIAGCGDSEKQRESRIPTTCPRFEYQDVLRTLMPLRMALSLEGRVVISALLYPSIREEFALFLTRQADRSFAVTVFWAKRSLTLARESAPGTSFDIDIQRDFVVKTEPITVGDAEWMKEIWRTGMLEVARGGKAPPDVLGGNTFEFGCLWPSEARVAGFWKQEVWSQRDEGRRIMELCYSLWDAELRDGGRGGIAKAIVDFRAR